MRLADVLPGAPRDPRPLAGVLAGMLPAQLAALPQAVPTAGGVLFPVPGPRGLPGPPGTGYVHYQVVPADTWTVTHGLGKLPDVRVLLSDNSVVEPAVAYVNPNTVTLSLGGAVSGTAYFV